MPRPSCSPGKPAPRPRSAGEALVAPGLEVRVHPQEIACAVAAGADPEVGLGVGVGRGHDEDVDVGLVELDLVHGSDGRSAHRQNRIPSLRVAVSGSE